jgi:hypothetical protein
MGTSSVRTPRDLRTKWQSGFRTRDVPFTTPRARQLARVGSRPRRRRADPAPFVVSTAYESRCGTARQYCLDVVKGKHA